MRFSQPSNSAFICPAFLKPVLQGTIIISFISVAGGAETGAVIASDKSLSEIMTTIVTPSSDVIWKAVFFEVIADGETLTGPANDEQWSKIRTSAQSLVAASDKMLNEKLPISIREPVEPPPGELSAQQIADLRMANWQTWAAQVNLLHAAGTTAISMIDARNVKGLSDVGNSIYEACDSCHMKFWYPEG